MSCLVGMQAAYAYLQEFQDLVQIHLNDYNCHVEELALQVGQVQERMVGAKMHSRIQTELNVLAAARLFPGVYAPYSSQRPQDQIVFATLPRYIPAPPTSLSSLSALMSTSNSLLASLEPLPIPCPISSIFTQSQNPHITCMPLVEDGQSAGICHSHICACDDTVDSGSVQSTPESRNKCARCG
jgi:hypothetical protein